MGKEKCELEIRFRIAERETLNPKREILNELLLQRISHLLRTFHHVNQFLS